MNRFINITDRENLNTLLSKLNDNATPLWGSLTPLHMLEHLVTTLEYTNGKKQTTCTLSAEEIQKRKQYMIYSEAEIPMGIQTPVQKTDPAATTYTGLAEAITALNKELDEFHHYFKTEGITSIHPGFGALNYKEWLIFHGKHFTHHCKQFGLL